MIIKSPSHSNKSLKVQRHHKLAAVAHIKTNKKNSNWAYSCVHHFIYNFTTVHYL